jgi:hypothetical protein
MADVFLTPFQDAPLDLATFPAFFNNRKAAIEPALASLAKYQLCPSKFRLLIISAPPKFHR